jgi:hypothetical protein
MRAPAFRWSVSWGSTSNYSREVMRFFPYIFVCLWFFPVCAQNQSPARVINARPVESPGKDAVTLAGRFPVPKGYTRTAEVPGSFAVYLRNLPLKPAGSPVLYYNGAEKQNNAVYDAVVDLPIGRRDLHQCADAVMRLRAEYLWKEKQYDKIHFNFTNGFRAGYTRWMKGDRIKVKGNHVSWVSGAAPSNTYADFWKYLETVFTYAGTLSLSREMKAIEAKDLRAGDVFIQGGSPGHAVMVVDVALDARGKKVFLLVQSYMPAQEIQVLQNPASQEMSPWYTLTEGSLFTPEWVFQSTDLKRFQD